MRDSNRWIVARPVAQFLAIGLIGLVTVAVATLIASRRIGEREAITDARTTALVAAQNRVQPVITDELLTGDLGAIQAVDDVVQSQLIDDSLVRVKIWSPSGEILYSDEPELIGSTYELGADEVAALEAGTIEAEVSDLSEPENRLEQQYGKLLEVYLPVVTPSGERVLFEAYYRYDVVNDSADRVWRSFAPVALGSLVVLELIQISLAVGLALRLRSRQREREDLLHRTLEASDVERRRIADDLHDGVVQDLTGVTFTLAGAARSPNADPSTVALLEEAATSVRSSVTDLRSLMVDIYPPDLEAEGLASSLSALLAGVGDAGLTTSLDASGLSSEPPDPIPAVLYRSAREAIRNVVSHAQATTIAVNVGCDAERAWLSVIDDGVGMDPSRPEQAASEGHFGLRGLEASARDLNGSVTIGPGPDGGTVVTIEVPLP